MYSPHVTKSVFSYGLLFAARKSAIAVCSAGVLNVVAFTGADGAGAALMFVAAMFDAAAAGAAAAAYVGATVRSGETIDRATISRIITPGSVLPPRSAFQSSLPNWSVKPISTVGEVIFMSGALSRSQIHIWRFATRAVSPGDASSPSCAE